MNGAIDDPFKRGLEEAERLRAETPIVIVDMHAEATSEKLALGYHLDGRVTAVLGTQPTCPPAITASCRRARRTARTLECPAV